MEKAVLFHNPTAGSGNHKKKDLEKLISGMGYEVEYYSSHTPFWERFLKQNTDVIFVAGGDGTVQKLAKAMLEAKEEKMQVPVQVLPYGTANNIAKTLKISKPAKAIEASQKKVGFDIGAVKGAKGISFFIEGMGCGIFPKLVQVMAKKDEDEIGDELRESLRELERIVDEYEAQEAIIIADKEEITGKFLLIELMNIRYIGPNFELAPNAETGDGKFELVTVEENSRQELKDYIKSLLHNSPKPSVEKFLNSRKVKEVRIKWKGRDVHIDDEKIENYNGEEIQATNWQGKFTFLKPQ